MQLFIREAQRVVIAGGVALPPCMHEYAPYRADPYVEFLRVLSWTYCRKCGLRFADGRLQQRAVCKTQHRCDLHPDVLEGHADPTQRSGDVRYYTTPDPSHWPRYDPEAGKYVMLSESATAEEQEFQSMFDLPEAEAETLAPLAINLEVCIKRAGGAVTVNMQKKSVIRAEWKPESVSHTLRTRRARAAYEWLMAHNETYASYIQEHSRVLAAREHSPDMPLYVGTSKLLLDCPGIEVAARPVLYARSAFGDSDHRARLM